MQSRLSKNRIAGGETTLLHSLLVGLNKGKTVSRKIHGQRCFTRSREGARILPPFILTSYVEGISFRDLKRSGDTDAIPEAAYSAGETLDALWPDASRPRGLQHAQSAGTTRRRPVVAAVLDLGIVAELVELVRATVDKGDPY